MAAKNRFYYAYSNIYGWTVYDRENGNGPAYDACAELLPPVRQDEMCTVMESPVRLGEYQAMRLARRLNSAIREVEV